MVQQRWRLLVQGGLQVRPITRKRKVEKILSNSDAVYVLYADGTWRKKEK